MGQDVAKLAVMISGGGRTLMNLADRIDAGELPASIVLVIASAECAGAERARARGFETRVMPGRIPATALQTVLHSQSVDWVVLAGYLKMVEIPPAFAGRVVNIHPSLLPRHGGAGMYGHRVHEAVLKSGDPVSGCTVHMCDEVYDRGRIVLQERVPVLADDTADSLAKRVFEAECRAYPAALKTLLAQDQSRTQDQSRIQDQSRPR